MAKQLACGDVMPGCPVVLKAETEAELMQKAAEHAASAHGVKQIPPDVLGKVKSAIKTV